MIVLHAGIPKTGSSAIQQWLRDSKDILRDHGFTLVVARPAGGAEPIRVDPHAKGTANSGAVIHALRDPTTKVKAASAFARQLERLATSHGPIVLSGESLSQPFWQHDRAVLAPLDDLARRHPVRVAYYVRPQHAAVEAAWRQWGFRTGMKPSEYVVDRARHLRYFETISRTGVEVPSIDFIMRPFRRDLLDAQDVVTDFAQRFLGIPAAEITEPTETNVGLPLEVVNLLATVPEGTMWHSIHDNRAINLLRELLSDIETTDASTEAGRLVLQGWARAEFGIENDQLLELMGWEMEDEWIPETERRGSLDALDRLWLPSASSAELTVLHRLLERAILD